MRLGPGELPVLDGVRIGLQRLALPLPVEVDVRVGQDPVQPCLQVGAGLVLVERRKGLGVGLLDEVLGVGGFRAIRMAAEYSWSTYCMASRSNRTRRSSGLSAATSISSAGVGGVWGADVLGAVLRRPLCVASTAGSTVLIAFKSTVTAGPAGRRRRHARSGAVGNSGRLLPRHAELRHLKGGYVGLAPATPQHLSPKSKLHLHSTFPAHGLARVSSSYRASGFRPARPRPPGHAIGRPGTTPVTLHPGNGHRTAVQGHSGPAAAQRRLAGKYSAKVQD